MVARLVHTLPDFVLSTTQVTIRLMVSVDLPPVTSSVEASGATAVAGRTSAQAAWSTVEQAITCMIIVQESCLDQVLNRRRQTGPVATRPTDDLDPTTTIRFAT
jgi:hypothetical protein